MSAVLKVENLNVTLTYRKTSKKLVENVNFEVHCNLTEYMTKRTF